MSISPVRVFLKNELTPGTVFSHIAPYIKRELVGFRTPSAEFQIPKPRIPDSTSKNFPILDSASKNVTGSDAFIVYTTGGKREDCKNF